MNVNAILSLCWLLISAKTFSHRIVKRIIYGDLIFSHEEWNTYHAVALVQSWACVTDQVNHQLGGCQQDRLCSGVLLTLDFVITACHCGSYKEFHPRPSYEIDLNAPRPPIGFFGRLYFAVRYYILKQKVHRFYSNIAILAGSPELELMNQKRHADRVFPHPYYLGKEDEFHESNNDIAIIRVCESFELTKTVKPAPVLPLNQLKMHFDGVVARSTACLLAGYGASDDPNIPVLTLIRSEILRFTWRTFACSSYCLPRSSPCIICTLGIPPLYGTASIGDSGAPIVCDGTFTGIITGGEFNGWINRSITYGFPLHCIKDAITPERLAHYSKKDGKYNLEFLGPLQVNRRRLRSFNSD